MKDTDSDKRREVMPLKMSGEPGTRLEAMSKGGNSLKKLLTIGLVLAVTALAAVPITALAATTTTGSFQPATEAPTVGTLTVPSSMTPLAQWTTVTVPVTDNNTLGNIDNVEVTLWYDATKAHGTPPTSGNAQTAAIFTWTRGGTFVLTGPSSTSWAINVGGCSAGTDTSTTGNWVFSFQIGKVATATTASSGWNVHAVATDHSSNSGSSDAYDAAMNWYGELSVATGAVSWSTVALGSGFTGNGQTGISVTYISNGDYGDGVKSDSTWSGSSHTATLDATGACATAGQFSLKANSSNTLGSAVPVTTGGVAIDSTGTQTSESGNTVSTNTLWLKIASAFPADTYSGTITYTIATRP